MSENASQALTQAQVGEEMGHNANWQSKLETGRVAFPSHRIPELAGVLQQPVLHFCQVWGSYRKDNASAIPVSQPLDRNVPEISVPSAPAKKTKRTKQKRAR